MNPRKTKPQDKQALSDVYRKHIYAMLSEIKDKDKLKKIYTVIKNI